LGADAAQCANYNSPAKTDSQHPYGPYSNDPTQTDPKHLYPSYSDEPDIRYSDNGHLNRKEISPSSHSPKGSPSQRKKSVSKGKKNVGGGTNVPDQNGISPSSPTRQSPSARRKSRPKSAPKRSPTIAAGQHKHGGNIVVDDYTTPELDDYSEEEIKLPDDAYTDDYEEDDEGHTSDTGGSLSPARGIRKDQAGKDGKTLNASNAQKRKGGKERRKKRKDDTKVTWHE
jgi:hypothetical protein